MTRRLILRDWEAEAWHAGRLGAVVRLFRARHDWYVEDGQPFYRDYVFAEPEPVPVQCPLGPPGQRLWIAESWALYHDLDGKHLVYLADRQDHGGTPPPGYRGWRSPATMPQWASRSTAVHLGSRLVRSLDLDADHGQAAWDANVWVWLHRIGRE